MKGFILAVSFFILGGIVSYFEELFLNWMDKGYEEYKMRAEEY